MKKIKSYLDACRVLKIKSKLPDFSGAPTVHRKGLLAHYKLVIIIQALNGVWLPNWQDTNEAKWSIVADMNPSNKSGFALLCVSGWCVYSCCGSRLCFRDRKTAEYAFKTFKQLFKDYFLIPN